MWLFIDLIFRRMRLKIINHLKKRAIAIQLFNISCELMQQHIRILSQSKMNLNLNLKKTQNVNCLDLNCFNEAFSQNQNNN